MFGRPPPPPPTKDAISLIRLPACAPFLIAASVAIASRVTLPPLADASTTTPSPIFSFIWSPKLRRPFISTSGTSIASTFIPLTSWILLSTSPTASLANFAFSFSFSLCRAFSSSCNDVTFCNSFAGSALAALATSFRSSSCIA